MIQVADRQKYKNIPFNDYLNIEAWSNSKIKEYNQPFVETHKTRIGKLVDCIISGDKYSGDQEEIKIASKIASQIISDHNDLLQKVEKQNSYTCKLVYEQFSLPFKTRPDFELPGVATIDLKVTWEYSKNINEFIKFMGYDTQCYIHRLLSGYNRSALMFYFVPEKKTKVIEICEDKSDVLIPFIIDYGKI